MKEKMWLGEALLITGAMFVVIGLMTYCGGAFQAEFVQREALVEGWSIMGFGGLLLLAGSLNLVAADPDILDADRSL